VIRAKTKIWGFPNQYDIQINLRRMEQLVSVDLYCHSWLEPGMAGECELIDSNITEVERHVDRYAADECLLILRDETLATATRKNLPVSIG
jgi:hypothetical protein